MARCVGCHLERQLGPLPVFGSPAGECVCPRCSKDIDRSIGILDLLGLEIIVKPISEKPEVARSAKKKDAPDT